VIKLIYRAETFSPKFTVCQFFVMLPFSERKCLLININWHCIKHGVTSHGISNSLCLILWSKSEWHWIQLHVCSNLRQL
jgi:hypothetical protein